MDCETICDPVPRASEMFARAHAIEIYTTKKKRHCFFPTERVEFVDAVSKANRRIHVTVQDYTDVHRQLEKRLRKERLKEEKRAKRERESA
jgi:phosphopantetheine adenylyltransferase